MRVFNQTTNFTTLYLASFSSRAGVVTRGVGGVLDVGAVLADAAATGRRLEDAAHAEAFEEDIEHRKPENLSLLNLLR